MNALGMRINPEVPTLVPLKTDGDITKSLKGMRAKASVSFCVNGKALHTEKGEIQFTAEGVSGIAVMQLSRLMRKNAGRAGLLIDFMPDFTYEELTVFLKAKAALMPQNTCADFLNGVINKRIGQALVRRHAPLSGNIGDISAESIEKIAGELKGFSLPVYGPLSWKYAQAACGGADISGFDSKTLMISHLPGIFAAGEMLDVDGPCGGFNLQWAWSSGLLAAKSALRYINTNPPFIQ